MRIGLEVILTSVTDLWNVHMHARTWLNVLTTACQFQFVIMVPDDEQSRQDQIF